MVGMRQLQVEKKNRIRRVVYMIYEGRKTEPNYFQFFSEEYSAGTFRIDAVPKDSFDKDNTDRDTLVQLMKGYVSKVTNAGYTPFQFATEILKDVFSGIFEGDDYNQSMAKEIWRKRSDCIKKAKDRGLVDRQGFVTDRRGMQKLVLETIKPMMDRCGIEYHDINPDRTNDGGSSELGKDDRIFIVFDRDDDISRMESTYLRIFDECDKMGYEVLLSTPHFEFWLLMHHDTDIAEYSITTPDLITSALEQLEGYRGPHGRYKCINRYRYDRYYRGRFEKAYDTSKSEWLSTELRGRKVGNGMMLGLINNIGSNVGVKLKELL